MGRGGEGRGSTGRDGRIGDGEEKMNLCTWAVAAAGGLQRVKQMVLLKLFDK